jgi:uncharacterized RDD family membrane protein YckC
MTIAESQAVLPPRYFWRRVVAFLIDKLIIALGFMFLMIVIADIWPASLPYMPESFFRTTTCEDGAANPNSADMLAKLDVQPGEATFVRICKTSSFMMPTRNWGFVLAEKKLADGPIKRTTTRAIRFSVDKAGNFYMPDMVTASVIGSVQQLLAIAAFAFLLTEWASPGKLAVHLRVVPVEGYDETNYDPPDFGLSLKREALKQMPILIAVVATGVIDLVAKIRGLQTDNIMDQVRFISANAPLIYVTTFLFAAFIFYWLIQPMIWWRGATRYDRILGLRVVRAPLEAQQATPPST